MHANCGGFYRCVNGGLHRGSKPSPARDHWLDSGCFYIFWEVHVTHNPESTSRWGMALKHLQSSVAVCFKDGSLHRFGLVMSNFGVERERAGLRARA